MKLYMDPITVGLAILLTAYFGVDQLGKFQDRSELRHLTRENARQATGLVTLAGNVQESAQLIQSLILENNGLEKKFEKTLKDKDQKTGEQFGILATQAETIARTTPASDTVAHYQTASGFMQQAGGAKVDQELAWNKVFIQNNMAEMALLQKMLEDEKKEKALIQQKLMQETDKNEQLAGTLVAKTQEHAKIAEKVQATEGALDKERTLFATIKRVIKYSVCIALLLGLAYVGFHVWQVMHYRKRLAAEEERRREANRQMYAQKGLSDEMKTLVKSFLAVGPEGNDQMHALLKANGLKEHFEDVLPPAADADNT